MDISKTIIPLLLFVCLPGITLAGEINAIVVDTVLMQPVEVTDDRMGSFLISRMDDVGNGVINVAKKTELVQLRKLTVNTANNSTRQVFSSIAGINIWESDALGLQLGIGGRGLSPDRSSNFTVRQNGYDIAADPLGYPESYYTPPTDLVDRIEVTRGGAALRYGTQFGGVVNFVTTEAPMGRPLQVRGYAGGGSFGLAAGALSLSGSTNALSYTGYYQYRKSDGWRANSVADQQTAYGSLGVRLGNSVRLRADITHMTYLTQQPGGLSDRMFADDYKQSIRSRNWFAVDWNVASLRLDVMIDTVTSLRSTISGMLSSRTALGNLNRITMADLGGERTMIDGDFANLCNETTITRDVPLLGNTSSFTAGFRLFRGRTTQMQGNASDRSGPDFTFLHPDSLEGSNYAFPNTNMALFTEAVVKLSDAVSLVPGVRAENINTQAQGWYRVVVNDLAGNHVVDSVVDEHRTRNRTILLGGLGVSYKPTEHLELYSNLVQNYRAITFTDLRVVNPNLIVDPNIQDERGFTADVGFRGSVQDLLVFDLSLFYLRYSNKIGEILKTDQPPLYLPYRYRTNVSDAYTSGIEAVAELSLSALLGWNTHQPNTLKANLFINGSLMNGRYVGTSNTAIANRKVEFVPSYTMRTGLRLAWHEWSMMLLQSMVGSQYSDATNSEYSASAVTGVIPSYAILDVTLGYTHEWLTVRGSVNNILDAHYFTRRAVSYPGPGIIPAEPRTFVLSVAIQWSAIPARNTTFRNY